MPIVDIFPSGDLLQQLVPEAASWQYKTEGHDDIMDNLRFLVVPEEIGQLPEAQQKLDSSVNLPPPSCSCADYFSAPHRVAGNNSDEVTRTLLLTAPGRLKGCSHYVAVSYRWQQSKDDLPSQIRDMALPKYLIQTATGWRPSRAPANVIYRAISYAKARSCRFIWIDQECIDQENQSEKEYHIQAMHLIYRSAQQVVAILNSQINTQAHLDVLASLGVAEGHSFKVKSTADEKPLGKLLKTIPFLETAVELAEMIAADAWYTRAWTLQEAIVAALPLDLLIPYHSSLTAPDWAGSIQGEIILSEAVIEIGFVRTFLWRLKFGRDIDHGGRILNLQHRAKAVDSILRETIPNSKTYKAEDMTLCRQTAADAIWGIMHRNISEPSDLIAIVGNLCQSNIRLDTRRVCSQNFSFTVSLLALALLNGDMSLILSLEEWIESSSESTDARSVWSLAPKCSLKDAIGLVRGNVKGNQAYDRLIYPPILNATGLYLSGYLWDFSHEINLEVIRDRFLTRWRDEGVRHGLDEVIFWAILEHLCELGRIPLLQAIFRTSRFEMASNISRKLALALQGIHPRGGLLAAEQWLVSTVLMKGKFYYATNNTAGCNCQENEQTYILGSSRPEHEELFTPRHVLVIAEQARKEPNSLLAWNVRTKTTQQQVELQCIGRSVIISCKFPPQGTLAIGYYDHFIACAGQKYRVRGDEN